MTATNTNFNNKAYIVTGANSGIGKCISKYLIDHNARVIMVDVNTDSISSMTAGTDSKVIKFDLNCPGKITEIFESLKRENIKVNGLVYCAGISPLMPLREFDLNVHLKTYNINVHSFVTMVSFFMNEEYTHDNCSIVGISSSTSIYGGNRQFSYSSTKSAMNLIVKSVAKELALRKTRINVVLPSITNTEMVKKLRMQSDAIDKNVQYKMPFGILEPDDLCKCISFLLTSDSSAISGTTLVVNNGEIY